MQWDFGRRNGAWRWDANPIIRSLSFSLFSEAWHKLWLRLLGFCHCRHRDGGRLFRSRDHRRQRRGWLFLWPLHLLLLRIQPAILGSMPFFPAHFARVQAIRTLPFCVRALRAPTNFPCLLVGATIFNALCRHLRTGADTANEGEIHSKSQNDSV